MRPRSVVQCNIIVYILLEGIILFEYLFSHEFHRHTHTHSQSIKSIFLRIEKHCVCNKAHLEGSIAEGYISEEANTKLTRVDWNSCSYHDNAHGCLFVFERNGRALGGEE